MLFLVYSFADNEPLVKAITVPEVVLELVSEFSSKEESCNNRKNNFNNYHYHENYKKEINKSISVINKTSISELKDFYQNQYSSII